MNEIRYRLLADGTSDRALLPILDWLLYEQLDRSKWVVQGDTAKIHELPRPPKQLAERIAKCCEIHHPFDLLFVHRDAEKVPWNTRMTEIQTAVAKLKESEAPTWAGVVPVRMTEAWLLIDEEAIRKAAGNERGNQKIDFPHKDLEDLPDPKDHLHTLIRQASGKSGRHLEKLNVHGCAARVSEFIKDFSPLRRLSAFKALEAELARIVRHQGWNA